MKARVIKRRRAGRRHAVVSVVTEGERKAYRKEPCAECPWRTDQVGKFPALAFRLSAHTAYDASLEMFGCHMSKLEAPATCAGFLLAQGAIHNLRVRIALADGRLDLDAVSSSVPLFPNYRMMAIANGVDPDDPMLALCRDSTTKIIRRRSK